MTQMPSKKLDIGRQLSLPNPRLTQRGLIHTDLRHQQPLVATSSRVSSRDTMIPNPSILQDVHNARPNPENMLTHLIRGNCHEIIQVPRVAIPNIFYSQLNIMNIDRKHNIAQERFHGPRIKPKYGVTVLCFALKAILQFNKSFSDRHPNQRALPTVGLKEITIFDIKGFKDRYPQLMRRV